MKPALVINFSISILLIASMSCSKPADTALVEGPKVVEPSRPNQLAGSEAPSQAAVKLLQGARTGPEAYYVMIAVHELLKSWKPEGKSAEELIRVLGHPSESEEGNLIYRYQDAETRCIWKFHLKEGVIQSWERTHTPMCG